MTFDNTLILLMQLAPTWRKYAGYTARSKAHRQLDNLHVLSLLLQAWYLQNTCCYTGGLFVPAKYRCDRRSITSRTCHIYTTDRLQVKGGLLHCLDMCKCTAALVDGRNEAFVDGRNTAPHLREPMPGSPVAAVFTAAGALLTRVIQVQLGSELGQCKLSGVHPAFCPALPFPMDQPDTIKTSSATSNLPLSDIHHQLV